MKRSIATMNCPPFSRRNITINTITINVITIIAHHHRMHCSFIVAAALP